MPIFIKNETGRNMSEEELKALFRTNFHIFYGDLGEADRTLLISELACYHDRWMDAWHFYENKLMKQEYMFALVNQMGMTPTRSTKAFVKFQGVNAYNPTVNVIVSVPIDMSKLTLHNDISSFIHYMHVVIGCTRMQVIMMMILHGLRFSEGNVW